MDVCQGLLSFAVPTCCIAIETPYRELKGRNGQALQFDFLPDQILEEGP